MRARTRKCSVCHDLYETKSVNKQICYKHTCKLKRLKQLRKNIFYYSCPSCNKIFRSDVKRKKPNFYCSDECKPAELTAEQAKPSFHLEIDHALDFPEQPLIQHVYNRMLAAKAPRSEDVDELIYQLVELYPEDQLKLHKISYSLPLNAVLKIASYYGTQL